MARKPKAGKRYPLNMRTTRELRQRIEDAARRSGRSLVQEVEFRLEQSFQKEQAARDVAKALIEHFEEKEVAAFAFKHTEQKKDQS